ncbi:hypothetical protein PIB30_052709 [Stylosanthes scabra]|uniref:Uncharacterized protein n=1 Tax=Stylosanthes scabra TaxID=79078 RepID=A0ABU6YIG2_9FABA|nr:hypothetical protein [Stylosanthes scabra]
MHNGDIVGFGCAIRDNNGDCNAGALVLFRLQVFLKGSCLRFTKPGECAYLQDSKYITLALESGAKSDSENC